MVQLVAGVSPTREFVSAIEARTDGNPFYIKELTRLLRDNGQLDDTTRTITAEDVPYAVSGVIRSRMAGLPRATRSALTAAALLGTEFTLTTVAQLLGSPAGQAAADLEPALRAGLIASGNPDQFRFSHGLVRDAVAAQLTGIDRNRMHADIARMYAAQDSPTVKDSFAGADHAWRAGAELQTDTALALLDRALETAWERFAYAEVVNLTMHGLDVCARLGPGEAQRERESDLWLQLTSVAAVTKGQNSKEVREALSRLAKVRTRQGQFALEAAFRCLEASGSGRYPEAAILAEGLVTLYEQTADPIAGSGGHYMLGLVRFCQGAVAEAAASIDTLIDRVPVVDWQRHGHLSAFDVRGYGVATWIAAIRGDESAVDLSVARGINLADARNDLFGRSIVRISALQARAILGQVPGTVDMARQVHKELVEHGVNQLAASARIIEAWAEAMGPGRPDTAENLRAAIALHAQDNTRIFLPLYYLLLADTEAAQGRTAAAATALDTAATVAENTGERVWDEQLAVRRQNLRTASRSSGPVRT